MPKVLISGGTSFIASHCIRLLLERNYEVVTTVRSTEKGDKVLKAFSAGDKNKLSYKIVEDVAAAGAFNECVKSTPDIDFVIHTTSPFHYNVQDPVKDFLEPSITGVTNILQAVKDYAPSVKRAVLLSSFASMRNDGGAGGKPPVYDETYWNPITWEQAVENPKQTYQGSKALAERAAWDFMEKEHPSFTLVTICPSLVFGPVAPHLSAGETSSLNTSNARFLDLLTGKMKDKLQPTGFYSWVDVRDVAFAHVQALEVPEAAGQRFFLVAGYHTNKQIAEIIQGMGGDVAKNLPDDLEAASQGDDFPSEDKRYGFDNSRSRDVLGVQYVGLETCVKDTVQSLVKLIG